MSAVIALKPQTNPLRVLLIEDSVSDALLIAKSLEKIIPGGCVVHNERTLAAAVTALNDGKFDVALLDMSLPDSQEFDGLLSIQNQAPNLPVVILTAYADEELALKAVERGAQDYLFKDKADGKALRHAMRYAVQRKQFESTLITQANFDPITGLANRTLFESRLDMALARMRRSQLGLGVFFLDLNRFKQVNDTHGHAAGDALLVQVADRLQQCVRPYDTTARFGGDEFALLAEGIAQPRDCAAVAQKILNQIETPFTIEHKKIEVGVSIGIVTCGADEKIDRQLLLLRADEAMYGAKLSPESSYRFYTPEIHEEARARFRLEEELRRAIKGDELTMHYQPKVNLIGGCTQSAEALVRWSHPVRGLLLPGEFMAVADETGMAIDIGKWVLRTVCADLARWRESKLPPVQIAVNLSVDELDDPALAEFFRVTLKEFDVSPQHIAVEVPGETLLERMKEWTAPLEELREMGIAVHLDHFGTTAISLAVLKLLPIDALKIAPALTRTINDPDGMLPLVQSILDIAERFGVDVVAAGIENDWQRSFFKEHRCREGQGFSLCRPVPGEYLPEWLKTANA